ncbi:hypothetical protein Pyn_17191 [Prunus yedoensis var. nudiflora]|uniref:Uncharacterized protein n=1 Tax=Prunus yedoensis var. nudiflora TaxID=2094558 RepID=A0A314V2R3_PRUYE|nr:hypothetical protein Pyn_17191 [Prunus yedoensis var. nudiflora]
MVVRGESTVGGVWVGERGSEFEVSEGERARVCDGAGTAGWEVLGLAIAGVVVWTFGGHGWRKTEDFAEEDRVKQRVAY